MPSIAVHPPATSRSSAGANSPLPQLLQTPSGLAIVEIQGTVNAPSTPQHDRSYVSPVPIGSLVFPYYNSETAADDTSWHKRVYLYIGKHQRLTGEVKKLSNPIALLRRRVSAGHENERDEMEVAEIVYYKLLFAHRPEPVGAGSE